MSHKIMLSHSLLAICSLSFAGAIEISDKTQKKIGLTTTNLIEKTVPPTQSVAATVISPASLIDAYRQVQQATLSASVANTALLRAEKLYADHELVALKDVESARILRDQETTKLQTINDHLLIEWGIYFEKLPETERKTLLQGLLNGTCSILRISVPSSVWLDKTPTVAVLHSLAREHVSLRCEQILPSPTVDPVFQSQTFYGILHTKEATLAVGSSLLGLFELEGIASHKLFISQDTVVVYLGKTWIYQQSGEEFERTEINTSDPCDGGWLVPLGIDQSKKVVSVGAASLLSQETMSSSDPEE